MNTTESFLRGKIADYISSTETVPFNKKVSKLPELTSGYITISPDTDEEEIFYYDGVSGTAGLVGTITITQRGFEKDSNVENVSYQHDHIINSIFKGTLNHIIINEKVDKTDLASISNGEGASTVGIEDVNGHFTSTDVEGALEELADGAPGVADASETVAGKVEIATTAEYEASTDVGDTGAILIVKPSDIQDSLPEDASETTKGLVEKATSTEAIARTDDIRYITAKASSDINQTMIQSPVSKSYNTIYQAEQNGILHGWVKRQTSLGSTNILGYNDENVSPTKIVCAGHTTDGSGYGGLSFPIKSGTYYKVTVGTVDSGALYFTPLI